jgi:DNA-nicking Smr family endonuclease
MAKDGKKLSDEDRILWSKVALTAVPLKGKIVPNLEEETRAFEQFLATALEGEIVTARAEPKPAQKPKTQTHPFDAQTRDKLSKGKLAIGGTVDLHGMTQSEAHSLLLSFLHRAHAAGMRYVLVITGKGASFGSEGALKRAVPNWLSTPAFRALVSSHDAAARHHGGSGALYLRLRRQAQAKP